MGDICGTVDWVESILEGLGVESIDNLSPFLCSKPRKETIGEWLCDSLSYMKRLCDEFQKLKDSAEPLKAELIKSQQQVISLQNELLESKNEQLRSLQSSVENSVKESVTTEMATYSAKLQLATPSVVADTVKLKEAVRSAVAEEDKSKNLMIIGKADVENEDLSSTVAEILQDINEKPQIVECLRVGFFKSDKIRPIRVKLRSTEAVSCVLRNAKDLKNSTNNKKTFLGPDRTLEERNTQKKLVDEMKEMIRKDSDKYYYIRGGTIISAKRKTIID